MKPRLVDYAVIGVAGVWAYLAFPLVISRHIYFTREFPNPAYPRTLNDKLLWRKVFDRNPDFVALSDKIESQNIARQNCDEVLIPKVLWIGHSPQKIPDAVLKGNVVVKATHGSGFTYPVFAGKYNRKELEKLAARWLARTYGKRHGEWGYFGVKPQLYVEEMILDEDGGYRTTEAKIYIYCGKLGKTSMIYDRQFGQPMSDAYTVDWQHTGTISPLGFPRAHRAAPANCKQIERMAVSLCKGIDHARVDLYLVGDQVWFGEYTLYNQGGYAKGPKTGRNQQHAFELWNLHQSWVLSTPQSGFKRIYAASLRRLLANVEASI